MIAIGSLAPDFELPSHNGGAVRLSAFRGTSHVVIAFHPLAFTPVCAAQMQTYERERARLEKANAHVLAISLDAGPSKKAWADALGGFSYDFLSDFHPHGQVTRAYGVMRPDGLPERAIILVDTDGIVRWTKWHDIPEHPNLEELFTELVKLRP